MNKKYNIIIAPSIFAADFYNLSRSIKLYEESGVDYIHFDVMDNHFVPNISFGQKIIYDIITKTKILSDIHLMIDLEYKSIDEYLNLPVNHITIHYESANNKIWNLIEKIKNSNKTVGISIKPATPINTLIPFFKCIDLILIMSVEPGFSGQKFKIEVLEKIKDLRKILPDNILLQVDGGIDRNNYKEIVKAGANFLVIGSAFANDNNPVEWVKEIHNL